MLRGRPELTWAGATACSRVRGARAVPGRRAGAPRVQLTFVCVESSCVHADTAWKDMRGDFTVESGQWVRTWVFAISVF